MGWQLWGRRVPRRLAAAAAGASLLAGLTVQAAPPTPGGAPPLPPQPQVAGGPTGCPAPRPSQAVLFAEQTASLSLRVDRAGACVLYRSHDAQTVDRSLDEGHAWQTVFHDATSAACPVPVGACPVGAFAASGLVAVKPGTLLMAESGNGDAVVLGTRDGASWSLDNGGGTLSGQRVLSVTPAPSDPLTAYALAVTVGRPPAPPTLPSPPPVPVPVPLPVPVPTPTPLPQPSSAPAAADSANLWFTHDGGGSWTLTQTTFPYADSRHPPLLAVDPTDPKHYWVVTPGSLLGRQGGQGTLYESRGTATGPTSTTIATNNSLEPGGLAVISSSRHDNRLALLEVPSAPVLPQSSGGPGAGLLISDSDGSTWFFSPAPDDLGAAGLAIDPRDPDRALYAGIDESLGRQVLRVTYTEDGFDTGAVVKVPTDAQTFVAPPGPWGEGGVLQADQNGVFYLHAGLDCAGQTLTTCDRHSPNPVHVLARLHPVFTSVPSGGGGAIGGTYGGPILPLAEIQTCKLPAGASDNGAVGFDGKDIIYTEAQEGGGATTLGVIHRMNALSCRDDGDVKVQISADQYARLTGCYTAWAGKQTDGRWIDDLTYDVQRQSIWFNLESYVGQYDYPSSCVARVPVPLDRQRAPAQTDIPWINGCGGGTLAYDQFDETLWTCDRSNNNSLFGHIAVATGSTAGRCVPGTTTGLPRPGAHAGQGGISIGTGFSGGVATWVVGGPHRLYVQDEDDQTVWEFDTVSCVILAAYNHRVFSEANAEEEQMACDPITFGPANAPAIWIRDQQPGTVSAYRLTDGYCPLLTRTAVSPFLPPVPGEPGGGCATVVVKGRELRLPGLAVSFLTEDGTLLGSAATNPAGLACTSFGTLLPPGRHVVTALFSGLRGLYGSSDAGPLEIQPGPPPPPPVPVAAAAAPPPPPVPEPPAPAHPPVQAPQGPAQAQTQMNPVSQAQGQAATATAQEEQQQVQVALALEAQSSQADAATEGWSMTRLDTSAPAPLAALLWLGGGVGLSLFLALGIQRQDEGLAGEAARRRRRP